MQAQLKAGLWCSVFMTNLTSQMAGIGRWQAGGMNQASVMSGWHFSLGKRLHVLEFDIQTFLWLMCEDMVSMCDALS